MIVMFVGTDRTQTAVNPAQVTFVTQVSDGTRIRFGEGRSVTVTEPIDAVIDSLNQALRPHE
ncbi:MULTISPECIES: hypothetical protein [Sphingomonadaceae]|jgi:hypothetical protein|uniref:Flagellar FlbD family protein n=1 Tax=Sphingobium soli TaxID=1591116 RepID=A0ABS8H0A9_9SPHN|nr:MULTISPECIES: hypothetical protein [Sphingomonadaceae]MEE2740368.1 hypothetical protein [Pseudomonadota bacterium]EAT07879.1 hypothetical protein SKA58_04591 [Sphingomonas sp. SKA58]MAP44522.1 hypothetical protein [Sphingobium sp.]MAX14763.1 hypothetical protein [Sphingobium sp.]MBS48554.1 hypothetical protein [Sphingobium sp.]|tara:strand:+ start:1680 stop:1865 length:186 start_codon:yes stop_codon:yes gene_type:complete